MLLAATNSLYIIRYTNEEIFKKEDEVVDDIPMTVIELLKMKRGKGGD